MSTSTRYDRSIRLFGVEGQDRLRRAKTAVIGVSGLGSPLVQQLALLGVGKISLIEPEELEDPNRNRFVGARHTDPIPGSQKVDLARRLILETNPEVEVDPIGESLVSERAFSAVASSDWLFGCVDHDGPRYLLNELAAAHDKPCFDLASDVPEPGAYGGRVVLSNGRGCVHCRGVLDMADVQEWLSTPEDRAARRAIYGIDRNHLDGRGPSVSPLNAVVAGLAAMEFMVAATGLRPARGHLIYRGNLGVVTESKDLPAGYCPFCGPDRGRAAAFDVPRYLRIPHLNPSRAS